MRYGHSVKIIDKQHDGEPSEMVIDGLTLHVKRYMVERRVGDLCEVTFTVFATDATVEYEGRKP